MKEVAARACMQAEDRAHRIGQKKAVLVLVLVAAGTIEQAILERAKAKRDIDAKVIQVRERRRSTAGGPSRGSCDARGCLPCPEVLVRQHQRSGAKAGS